MEVQLKVLVGNTVGQVLKIAGPKFFIGRAEDCHLRPNSDLVSRHHCVLMLEGTSLVIRDFGSKNGTILNGDRVIGEAVLSHGDTLKVGPLEFEVHLIESLAGAKRSRVNSVKEAAVRTAESGVHDDLNFESLLGSAEVDTGDTRELRRGDTAELEMGGGDTTIMTPKPAAVPKPAPAPATAENDAHKVQTGSRKVVGKQIISAKKECDSSKDAAAEMLKRLRRR